jgi:outer membrane protein TolC
MLPPAHPRQPRRRFPLLVILSVRAVAAAVLACVALPSLARAQDAEALPDTSYLVGEGEGPTLGMTLEEAQKLAIANSPAARAALASVRAARGARMIQAGAFDPVATAEASRVSTDTPVTSPFAASETRLRSLGGGLSWLSPIGTSLAFSLSRVTTESNAPFSTLPRERRTRARLDFVQPLLKDFGLTATRGELRATEREMEAAVRRHQAAVSDLAARVEVAYWELYAAERDLSSQRLQRQRSAVFLRDQILRSRAGASGPGAVAAARTLLADQEVQLIDTRLRLQSASDLLREAIGISLTDDRRLHASDDPPAPPPIEPLAATMDRARHNNPTLRAYERDAAAALARFRRANRNAWPSLEAFGGYGGSGLAGTGRTLIFSGDTLGSDFDTGYGPAWDDVWSDRNPDWSFGLRLRMPIGWRSDRGERERQRGILERSQETLRAQTLALESAVRTAHREAVLSQDALRAMHTLVDAAREQARIGRLEYQAGRTTAYDLVGIEADLARAELRESQVLVRVARSLAELQRLTRPPLETTP